MSHSYVQNLPTQEKKTHHHFNFRYLPQNITLRCDNDTPGFLYQNHSASTTLSISLLVSIYSSKDRNKKTARQWAMAVGGQKANLIYLLEGRRRETKLPFVRLFIHSTHRTGRSSNLCGLIYFLFSMATIGCVVLW